jgi:hypothetical protein
MSKKFEIITIQFRKDDKDKLQQKADENRLKLSSYLRYLLTKDLNNNNE